MRAPRESARRLRATGLVAQTILLVALAAIAGLAFGARDLTVAAVADGMGSIRVPDNTVEVVSPVAGALVPTGVRVGDAVTRGQVLFRIERVTETAVQSLPEAPVGLRAEIARLAAEAAGAGRIAFPNEITGAPETTTETAKFDARRSQLDRKVQNWRDTAAQLRLEIAETKAAAARHARAGELARKELEVLGPLVDRGISPKLEYLRVEQKVQELEALREGALLAVPRLEAKLRNAEKRAERVATEFRDTAQRTLRERRLELAAARQPRMATSRAVAVTEIRAPQTGKVENIPAGPAGSPVEPGQTLARVAAPRTEVFVDASLPARPRIGARVGQTALVVYAEPSAAGRIEATVVAVNAPGPGGFRHARLRISSDTIGFDGFADRDRDVQVVIRVKQTILGYLLDRLSAASGGRIDELLNGVTRGWN